MFHGDEQLNIRLRFIKEAARRVRKLNFHPTQKTSNLKGGVTIVEFKCRGHWEVIHELLHPDWLNQVTIEKPDKLKKAFRNYLSLAQAAVE